MSRRSPFSNLFVTLFSSAFFAFVVFGTSPAEAVCGKQCKQAKNYCKNWEKKNPGEECGAVRGAICTGKSWKKIKQVNGLWSACKLVRGEEDLNKAKNRCREYEKNTSGNCEVHSPACKAGWVKLGKYGKFRACRKMQASGSLLYDSYKAFMRKWEGKADTRMPAHLRAFVSQHYTFDPARVRWGKVKNPHATCTTDCHNIYCGSSGLMDQIKAGRVADDIVFHELAHVEQCENKGGRKNYAKMWFGDLPVGFFSALGNVKDEFKNQVHDKMPMEKSAEKKAVAVFKKYQDGHYDREWRCRLYRGDEVVWTSDPTFRTRCEDPSSAPHKTALNKMSGKPGRYAFVFGNRSKTHHVIWQKTVAARRAVARPARGRK